MKIINCRKTQPTADLMNELMPDDLNRLDVVINLGNSNSTEEALHNWTINNTNAIKNSADKKTMFRLFKANKIPSVEYYDLNDNCDRRVVELGLQIGVPFVLRRDNPKRFKRAASESYIRQLDRFTYATIQEKKQIEYRIIVFNNRILRCMVKMNLNHDFRLKQHNCKFVGINKREFPIEVLRMVKKAVKCVGLDLSGVDVLLNELGEWKILEVNSGMGMNKRTINKLYNRIRKTYGDEIFES